MTHNEFHVYVDFIYPLKTFLKQFTKQKFFENCFELPEECYNLERLKIHK